MFKTMEELDDRLCDYCPLDDIAKGIHCYGGEPVMCEGSHCEVAYENYKEEAEEEMSTENVYPELTSKDFMKMSTKDIQSIYLRTTGCRLNGNCCRNLCPFGEIGTNWCTKEPFSKRTSNAYRDEQCRKELVRRGELFLSTDNSSVEYITNYEELLTMDGVAITCEIRGTAIKDAVISVEDSDVYLCQNEESGATAKYLKGYRYSYFIDTDDLKIFKIKKKGVVANTNYSQQIVINTAPFATSSVEIVPSIIMPTILGSKKEKIKKKKRYTPDDYPSIDWKSKTKTNKCKPSFCKEW